MHVLSIKSSIYLANLPFLHRPSPPTQEPPPAAPTSEPNSTVPSSTLKQFQIQLHDCQTSLAPYIDEVQALTGNFTEHETIVYKVVLLR